MRCVGCGVGLEAWTERQGLMVTGACRSVQGAMPLG